MSKDKRRTSFFDKSKTEFMCWTDSGEKKLQDKEETFNAWKKQILKRHKKNTPTHTQCKKGC